MKKSKFLTNDFSFVQWMVSSRWNQVSSYWGNKSVRTMEKKEATPYAHRWILGVKNKTGLLSPLFVDWNWLQFIIITYLLGNSLATKELRLQRSSLINPTAETTGTSLNFCGRFLVLWQSAEVGKLFRGEREREREILERSWIHTRRNPDGQRDLQTVILLIP